MFEIALAFQVIVWLAVLCLFLASGQATLFHPSTFYLVFHGLVFVLRTLMVYFYHFDAIWNYIGFQPSESDMIKTLGVTSVALIAFVGTNVMAGRTNTLFPATPAASFSPVQFKALAILTILLFPWLILSIRASTSGEVTGELTANGTLIMTNSTGYINDAQFMIAPLLTAWLLVTRCHRLNFVPIVLYVAYRTWCGWSRFTIISFLLAVVLVICWQYRKKWIPLSAIILGIPLLMLFNTLGHNRDYLQEILKGEHASAMELDSGMSKLDKFKARADTQDFANFDYLTFIVSLVPARTGTYTYGAQYLQLFTEPIPRILWKGKPAGAPVRTFNMNAYGNFTGLTFSLPGDGWSSGGWIGVVVTVSVVGMALGIFHRWFWRHINNPMVALFYTSTTVMLMQWYRDGGISIAKFLLWNWLPLILWIGMTWLLSGMPVPGNTMVLRTGERLRLVRPGRGQPVPGLPCAANQTGATRSN